MGDSQPPHCQPLSTSCGHLLVPASARTAPSCGPTPPVSLRQCSYSPQRATPFSGTRLLLTSRDAARLNRLTSSPQRGLNLGAATRRSLPSLDWKNLQLSDPNHSHPWRKSAARRPQLQLSTDPERGRNFSSLSLDRVLQIGHDLVEFDEFLAADHLGISIGSPRYVGHPLPPNEEALGPSSR